VRTNAKIPKLDVLFVGGFDEEASPLGAKDFGELTEVSVAPATANAVYHATCAICRSGGETAVNDGTSSTQSLDVAFTEHGPGCSLHTAYGRRMKACRVL
jgi:hypothetical protein